MARCQAGKFLEVETYIPPSWTEGLALRPSEKYRLAMLPTPIHRWPIPGLPDGMELYIKRDDLSGMQMSGNKVRKLEFLMAEAKRGGHDCVITIGGIQSNHCRATATAARYLGLDVHLILRNTAREAEKDPGLVGNLLVERLQGCYIHQVSKAEYVAVGSERLGELLKAELESQGKKPYVIPVGGSNALGCWGYMNCMDEIAQQSEALGVRFTDIAMACGSGATTGGLALANRMSGYGAKVWGYGVCDDEAYFYDFIDGLLAGLGATEDMCNGDARSMVNMVQCKGAGYAISRDTELKTVQDVAMATGVVLDPVYSGKALHAMISDMQAHPEAWKGRKVLFIHTGGLLGMYDKVSQLQPMVESLGRVCRMQVPGVST